MDIHGFFTSLDISWTNAAFALAAAVLSFIVMRGALALFRRRLCQLEEQRAHRPVAEVLKETLARTSNLAVIATALLVGLSLLHLPPPWDERVRHLWFLTLGAQLALYLHRAIEVSARRYFRRRNHRQQDEQVTVAQTLLIWVLQTSVWTVFVLAMLSNLGINVTTFVASLGIGGVAIALAVQNILGDLFASLSIAVDKPFEVGDFISTNNFSGTVEHVGLKTTRIRALSGEQVVVSNAEVLKNTLHNFKRMTTRRVQWNVRASAETPHDLAAKVPAALERIVKSKDKVAFDRAHLMKLDQNFIEYEIIYIVLDADYKLFMDVQQRIILETMQMFEELGISTSMRPQQMLLREQRAANQDEAQDTLPRGSRPALYKSH